MIPVESIWFRKLTEGDFFNIERGPNVGPAGGGGQTYIDIPNSVRIGLFEMLGMEEPTDEEGPWLPASIEAKVIGAPERTGRIRFELNRKDERRYRIAAQARQKPGSERHPAWTEEFGFPKASDTISSKEEGASLIAQGVHIFVVKTRDGDYFAGHTQGTELPDGWPQGIGLERLFDPSEPGGRIAFVTTGGSNVPELVQRILAAWKRRHNVLLYGPPGTGKTFAMSYLWQMLERGIGAPSLFLDPEDVSEPFKVVDMSLPFPEPVRREWVTFHQNYSYEEFVVGLRPKPVGGVLSLTPRLGRLLDLVVSVGSEDEETNSGVVFIDEINRGNVSRIFGEFITFMDAEYRATLADGSVNGNRLPVPLPGVNISGSETEEIERPAGGSVKLPHPTFFPFHVYSVASMNSVDRAVAPLDSALGRRFERIEARADLPFLASWLGVDESDIRTKIEASLASDPGVPPSMSASETAWALLHRLNYVLATGLGPEFELGHTFFMSVKGGGDEQEQFLRLATAWDESIFPQLQERFIAREEELLRILKADQPTPSGYAFRLRQPLVGESESESASLQPVALADLAVESPASLAATLRFLALP